MKTMTDTFPLTPWWAIAPGMAQTVIDRIGSMFNNRTVNMVGIPPQCSGFSVVDGIAKIDVSGVLMKSVPGWFRLFGVDATAYSDVADYVKEAANDTSVREIHLMVNSPGGTVEGSAEAADAIYGARGSKPIKAFIEGQGASGAYLLACQADEIIAEKNASVGSIGVYSYLYDYSEMAAKQGIKAVVFASGKHKGVGIPGTEITDEHRQPLQAIVDGMADNFIESVSRGRGVPVSRIEEIATGQSWIAKAAKEVGLVDTVVSSIRNETLNTGDNAMADKVKQQEALEALAKAAEDEDEDDEEQKVETDDKDDDEKAKKKAKSEKDDEEDEKAEDKDDDKDDEKASMKRLASLRAAFPNDPAFVLDQFAAGADVTQAKAAHYDRQQAADGAEPVASATHNGTSGNDFMSLSRDLAASEKITITEAMKRIRAQNPGLHESYLKNKN